VRALSEGLTTADAWKAECHVLGIAGQPLGGAAAIDAGVSVAATTVSKRSSESHRPAPTDQVNCWHCKRPLPVTKGRGKIVKCSHCNTKQQLPF
jgi:LSD1 subclass zinc finger protein